VSSVLLYALLQAGMVKDSIKPPGLEVSLPAPFALVFLVIISSGMGWAGWAFLSQARRLMYRLEFDVGIDTGTIKAVLAGSSLISASVLLVKSLCLFAFFSLGIATTNVWFPLSLLISVPYFLVVLSPRTRYFNPDNWSSASFSLLFRYPLNPKLQEIARKIRVGRESVIGVQPAKELGLCDPVKLWEGIDKLFSQTIPPALAIAVHTVIRKHGISLLIHWKLMEKTLCAYDDETPTPW